MRRFIVCAYYMEEDVKLVGDAVEVTGKTQAERIAKLWRETGRFTSVTVKPAGLH